MDLAPCPACRRHVDAADARCPFCDAAIAPRGAAPQELLGRFTRAALAAGVAAGASMTLAACYGGPPRHMSPPKEKVWDVASGDPKAFIRSFSQKATARGCGDYLDESRGTLSVGCDQHGITLYPYDDHVRVTCQSHDLEGCERTVREIVGEQAPSASSVPSIGTIAPPGMGDAG